MNISQAAMPPSQPSLRDVDRDHPWFPIYMQYRATMSAQLVEADSFANWKSHREHEERMQHIQRHPRFSEFQMWMRDNRGGARKCPGGNSFPNNFRFWLEGGRW